jgi:hypothetical protein
MMTRNQKLASWGLTGLFSTVFLVAAPQLSVWLIVKYGLISTALGFSIAAISNFVGTIFPDNGHGNTTPTSHSSVHIYPSTYSPPVTVSPATRYTSFFGKPPTHGTLLNTRVEPVRQNPTYLGSRIEPVGIANYRSPVPIPTPPSNPPGGTYLRSTFEPVPSPTSAPQPQQVSRRFEPL